MIFEKGKSNVFTIQPVIQSVLQKSISNFKMFVFKKYENKQKNKTFRAVKIFPCFHLEVFINKTSWDIV